MTTTTMKPPTVGQRLFSLNVGNYARNTEQKLTPVIVSKVGRKYFTCKREDYHLETQYHLEDWREKTEYCVNSALYESEQAWEDEKEAAQLCKQIHQAFEYGRNPNLPVSTLRQIAALLP